MDIRELKQLLKHSTTVVILEQGEPSLVVTDYRTYRALASAGESGEGEVGTGKNNEPAAGQERPQPTLSTQELEMIDRLNKEIMALKEQIEAEERGAVVAEEEER